MRQRLRHDRRLNAVAEIDATVATGVQYLLNGHGAGLMDITGDGFEFRQEAVIVERDLPEVRFAFAERVGIGALIGDDAAAGAAITRVRASSRGEIVPSRPL